MEVPPLVRICIDSVYLERWRWLCVECTYNVSNQNTVPFLTFAKGEEAELDKRVDCKASRSTSDGVIRLTILCPMHLKGWKSMRFYL